MYVKIGNKKREEDARKKITTLFSLFPASFNSVFKFAIMALLAFASLLKLLSADGEIGLKYCTNSKFSRSHQSGICLITAFSKDISVLSSVAVKS